MIEKISYEHVLEIARQMAAVSQKMKEICDESNVEMKKINSGGGVFDSKAASVLKNNYDRASSKFQSFYDAVKTYSLFLEKTVATYKAADAAISSKAEEFLS